MNDKELITLSDEQKIALIHFDNFMRNPAITWLSLSGAPGTGKTFLTKQIVEYSVENGFKVKVAAPTHQAVKIVKKFIKNPDIEVSTLASLLRMKKYDNYETGEQEFVPDVSKGIDEDLFKPDTLLIIDESSMIDWVTLAMIDVFKCKILFVGDQYQIPPVRGNGTCPVFMREGYGMALIEIQRQAADNPNVQYAHRIRAWLMNNLIPFPVTENQVEAARFLDAYNPETDLIVSYTNKTVKHYNDIIRKRLGYGVDYEVNEKLIAGEPITKNDITYANNNDELLVRSVERTTLYGFTGQMLMLELTDFETTHHGDLKAEAIKLNNVDYHSPERNRAWAVYYQACRDAGIDNPNSVIASPGLVPIFVPDDRGAVNKWLVTVKAPAMELLRELKILHDSPIPVNQKQSPKYYAVEHEKNEIFSEYFAKKAEFAKVQPPFARTAHKAQGSTYENVFIDAVDMNTCKKSNQERLSLLYVGVTRARKNVSILGQLVKK